MKNLVKHLKSIFSFYNKGTSELMSFRLIFTRFRQVLDSHNRAVEIIADMGDKLGGDYLFDINYIKKAYSELSDAMYNSLEDFDILTKNKYLKLHDVFDNIDALIKRTIYDIPSACNELILLCEDIMWERYSEVGGKSANLAEIKNYLKINVPDGFAITTRAFDEFIKHNGLNEKIESLVEGVVKESALNELQDLVINAEIPPELNDAIDSAIKRFEKGFRKDNNVPLACSVRSSAVEEDGEFSFAGQFETIMNVPLECGSVEDAYKRVIASLFSPNAVLYQQTIGYDIRKAKMAVCCMLMVDAATSGVIYSANPNGDDSTMIINSSWGLGKSIVDGEVDADLYLVSKGANPVILNTRVGEKNYMLTRQNNYKISMVKLPDDMVKRSSLTEQQAIELSRHAMLIEKHFRKPQDIEWAIDKDGRVFILQTRPLRVQETQAVIRMSEAARQSSKSTEIPIPEFAESDTTRFLANTRNDLRQKARSDNILMKDKGIVVQHGIGAGRVFIMKNMDDIDNFPKGAVLVARNDSSNFIRIMPYASAIITDVGVPTSHMASLCREFRVPAIVNTGNATQILRHGQEVTINANDDSAIIYNGIDDELLEHADTSFMKMENVYEFRKKRYLLRYISPLNLIDPLLDNFTPEGCKTIHDILRFIHEKSVMELVETAMVGLKGQGMVKLDLPIPTGIVVVDIGGGLNITEDRVGKYKDRVTFEQVASIPLRAVLKGMMHTGVWHADAVSLGVRDFLSSMMKMSDITSNSMEYVGYNVAVISGEYLNLSLRFGYHFNMIDCYCSENTRNNHIYFRFIGGATDIVKRSRRIQLIAVILKKYNFNINIKGDIIIARLANIRQDEMDNILDQLGRLIAYTRQLDAVLNDDGAVERYARQFMEEKY
ncbi:phosphoenolpyruvate synthase [Dissulfurispira thermophila]|uniref:Phosphoenolpyruvate synthase n=2 Tax=root TaxID=1 RepID=A0A7G1H087_9BACT|nr:PEP/pyruvate-binding domain-containing protein [Dissulfurispira thermophila]BCB95712.1 phosphoenolpyruvate synthase [Dissulfurispira thermophila]